MSDTFTDAQVVSRIPTGLEAPARDRESLLAQWWQHGSELVERRLGGSYTSTTVLHLPHQAQLDVDFVATMPTGDYAREALVEAFGDVSNGEKWAFFIATESTRATTSTATTVSSLRGLLRRRKRDERLSRMSSERRDLYERIHGRREAMEPVSFDLVEALRDIRENG